MGIMLGSAMDGLFKGAGAVYSLYGGLMDIEDRWAAQEGASKVKNAAEQQLAADQAKRAGAIGPPLPADHAWNQQQPAAPADPPERIFHNTTVRPATVADAVPRSTVFVPPPGAAPVERTNAAAVDGVGIIPPPSTDPRLRHPELASPPPHPGTDPRVRYPALASPPPSADLRATGANTNADAGINPRMPAPTQGPPRPRGFQDHAVDAYAERRRQAAASVPTEEPAPTPAPAQAQGPAQPRGFHDNAIAAYQERLRRAAAPAPAPAPSPIQPTSGPTNDIPAPVQPTGTTSVNGADPRVRYPELSAPPPQAVPPPSIQPVPSNTNDLSTSPAPASSAAVERQDTGGHAAADVMMDLVGSYTPASAELPAQGIPTRPAAVDGRLPPANTEGGPPATVAAPAAAAAASVPPATPPPEMAGGAGVTSVRGGTGPTSIPSGEAAGRPAQAISAPSPTGQTVVSSSPAPNPAGPAIQSEPPSGVTPQYTIQPWLHIQRNNPELAKNIVWAAGQAGIQPQQLAAIKWLESRDHDTSPDGKPTPSGTARGIMQVLPSTQKSLNLMHLDPSNQRDSLLMGAMVIAQNNSIFGEGTPASMLAYHQGPGKMSRWARNYDQTRSSSPHGADYESQLYPGMKLSGEHYKSGDALGKPFDAAGFVQATADGPAGALAHLVQTSPEGMHMTDLWRRAEIQMVYAALRKGDIQGAAHARNLVTQMSQQGTAGYLMQAHSQLSSGDAMGAASSLARGHAFFPDGTTGRFGVDQKGQLWGERFDELNPSRRIGSPFKITPQSIAPLLIKAQDPTSYVKYLQDERDHVEKVRMHDATIKHGEAQIALSAATHADTASYRADTLGETKRHHGALEGNVREGIEVRKSQMAATQAENEAKRGDRAQKAADAAQAKLDNDEKVTGPLYGSDMVNPKTGVTEQSLARAGQIHRQMNQHDNTMATSMKNYIARGISENRFQVDRASGDVINKETGKVEMKLPPGLVSSISSLSFMRQPAPAPEARKPDQRMMQGPVGIR